MSVAQVTVQNQFENESVDSNKACVNFKTKQVKIVQKKGDKRMEIG